jgi:hypothetical protein
MPEIKNTFVQGKMNKDLDDRLLPNGQYRDAENITVSKSESSNVGVVQNVKGNTYAYSGGTIDLPESLAAVGVTKFKLWDTIGYYANSQTGDVFWFVTSFTGTDSDNMLDYKAAVDVTVGTSDVTHDDDTTGHRTVEIANSSNHDIQVGMKVTGTGVVANSYVESITVSSNTASVKLNKAQTAQTTLDGVALTFEHTCRIYHFNVIENTSPAPILDNKKLSFSKNHHIHHVNLLGNLLFWTDNYNQPRRINIDTTSFYSDDDFFEDKISVAQFAPYAAPKVKLTKVASSTVPSLHLRDKFVKFGYRYVYTNNEVSLISPFTQTCFLPGKGKNINHGSFKTGEAGLLTFDETKAVQKTTVVDMMQNMVNRVHLFIDLPSDENKSNVATAEAGPATVVVDAHMAGAAASNQTIHSISAPGSGSAAGVIDNTSTMLTTRGDQYTVASITENSDLGADTTITFNEEIPANLGIVPGENLYFFKNIGNYTNPLKIKRVEIVYAESNSPAIKIVHSIKIPTGQTSLNNIIKYRVEAGTASSGKLKYGVEYIYDSTKPIKTLPEQDITRVADIVPVKAKAQEVSGNRVIYGNFKLNRPITNLIDNQDSISVTSRDQTELNSQYLLHSVKQAREYSVGLVLSDRYGRQSTVFLPTANTTYVTPKTTEDIDGNGPTPVTPMTDSNDDQDNADLNEGFVVGNLWKHTALNMDFGTVIGDVYDKNTNPYGWYSYKVVVKQPQQEYYNVYVPSLIDDFPTNEKSSWITLFGDNINKVPRDIVDGSIDNQIASSKTKLLPRILNANTTNPATGINTGTSQNAPFQQNITDYVEIMAIGTRDQFGTASGQIGANTSIVNKDRNPVMAEIPDGYGAGSGPSTVHLCVLETDPFVSVLDIYYETSTAGRLSDLNEAIQASLGTTPSGINITSNVFAENIAANTAIATLTYTDSAGNSPSGETYTLESVTDGGGADRTSEFQITSSSLKTASGSAHLGHEFKNKPADTFSFEIKVTDSSSNEHTETKTINLTNVAPTIISPVTSLNIPDNTTNGATLATYNANNGAGKLSAQQNSLGFSISSGNSANKFAIGSSTGVLTANTGSWTSGDTYSLGITVTDVGGLTASTTVNITITDSTVTRFYRSPGNTSATDACNNDIANQQAWHDGNAPLPTEGDKVYTNNTATTLFNGQNAYYVVSEEPSSSADENHLRIIINSSGVVSNPTLCTH